MALSPEYFSGRSMGVLSKSGVHASQGFRPGWAAMVMLMQRKTSCLLVQRELLLYSGLTDFMIHE